MLDQYLEKYPHPQPYSNLEFATRNYMYSTTEKKTWLMSSVYGIFIITSVAKERVFKVDYKPGVYLSHLEGSNGKIRD